MRMQVDSDRRPVVVKLYGSAARPVAELTGTTDGQRARVIVLGES